MKTRLTKSQIEATPLPQPGRRTELLDTEVQGLRLRLYDSGRRTWMFYYRDKAKRQHKVALGAYGLLSVEQARQAAKKRWTDDFERPADAPAPKFGTVGALLERYQADHLERTASAGTVRNVRYVLGHEDLTDLRAMNTSDVTRAGVVLLHDEIGRHSTSRATSTISYLRSGWRWGGDRGLCPEANPCARVKLEKPEPRSRTLESHERQRVEAAMERRWADVRTDWHEKVALSCIALIAQCGMRRAAAASLRRDDVDRAVGIFWLSEKAKPGSGRKNRVRRIVTSQVAAILDRCPASSNEYVFEGKGGGSIHPDTLWSLWVQIRGEAGCPDVRLHDLRRSFITDGQYDGGHDQRIVGGLVGHTSAATTQGYTHPRLAQQRAIEQSIADARMKVIK